MSYSLSWYIPDRLLHLELYGSQTVRQLEDISQEVLSIVESSETRLHILIDLTQLRSGYQTADHLRETQEYMNHIKLESAFVISGNKLNRLITLMAFSLCSVPTMKFNSLVLAEKYLTSRQLIPDKSHHLTLNTPM